VNLCEKLRDCSNANKAVFDKMIEREEMFAKFLDVEKSANDPERLMSDHGCHVIKQERPRLMTVLSSQVRLMTAGRLTNPFIDP